MKCLFSISAVALALGAVADVGPGAWSLSLDKPEAKAVLKTSWSDGSTVEHAITVMTDTQRRFKLPEAGFAFSNFKYFFCDNGRFHASPPKYWVRPNIGRYGTDTSLKPEGVALTNAWNTLPSAVGYKLRVDVVPTLDGRAGLWLDGSWMVNFAPGPKAPAAATLTKVELTGGANVTVTRETPLFDGVDVTRFTPIDLKLAPRPGSFAAVKSNPRLSLPAGVPWKLAPASKSSDVAVMKCVMGKWALECEEYWARTPADHYPYAITYRLPPALYRKAHLVVALENAPNRIPLMNLNLTHLLFGGSGPNMYSLTVVDWRKGIPADARKLGAISSGTNRCDIYAITVPLNQMDMIETGSRLPYVDFDILGPMANGNTSHRPDAKLRSSFHILAATLEKECVNFDEVTDPEHPGNAWTLDEKGKRHGFVLGAQQTGAKVTAAWDCVDQEGKTWFSGSRDFAFSKAGERQTNVIDCTRIDKPGLYRFPIRVSRGQALLFRTEMRLAVVPPAGRVVGKYDSPYCTWMWTGQHGTSPRWEDHLIPIQKAGIRKVSYCPLTREYAEKYDVTVHGGIQAMHKSFLDPKTGHFKPGRAKSGDEAFINDIRAQTNRTLYASHCLIWHENAPSSGLPPVLFGIVSTNAPDEKTKLLGQYVNECGRLLHEHFPNLRIQVGNAGSSWGSCTIPIRGGAKVEYIDSIGNEATCQTACPEWLGDEGPMSITAEADAIEKMTGRRVRTDGCWEFSSRLNRDLGERLQAAFYARDILVCLARSYSLVSVGGVYDCRTMYASSIWGTADMFHRIPYAHAKPSYCAYAALTKALDGVKVVKHLDTGSSTVYAVLFRRADGRYATAIWCSRGEAELAFDVKGPAEHMDMYGRTTRLGGLNSLAKKVGACSECPAYVITDEPVAGVKIVKRTFAHGTRLAAAGRSVMTFGSLAAVTNVPHPRLKAENRNHLAVLQPSDFVLAEVNDPERGPALEVKLDLSKNKETPEYVTEYTTVRLKKPVEIPGKPMSLGVWVKGNSSWGRIRFEVIDARGATFLNFGTAYFDWPCVQSVNFDGWAFVSTSLDAHAGLHWDDLYGLCGCANVGSQMWRNVYGPGGDGNFVYPLKLVSVTVETNRHKHDLLGFKPSDPSVLLGEVVAIERGAPKK